MRSAFLFLRNSRTTDPWKMIGLELSIGSSPAFRQFSTVFLWTPQHAASWDRIVRPVELYDVGVYPAFAIAQRLILKVDEATDRRRLD